MRKVYFVKSLMIFLFLVFILSSCNQKKSTLITQETVQGEWIVQAVHMDKDYYLPLTMVMEFDQDTLFYKSLMTDDSKPFKLKFLKDSLVIDSVAYPIRRYKITGDKLQFGKSTAHRIVPSDSINMKLLEGVLVSNYWKNEKGIFSFEEENHEMKFIPKNKTSYDAYCFELISHQDKVFLLKKGNQLTCDRDQQFIEQVLSVSEKQIETFGFMDGVLKKIIYTKTLKPKIEPKASGFQLCNKYLNKNNPGNRYYYQGTEYNGGLYHIRKIFNQKYNVPEDSKESGIFQVRFVVNCEGKAGMFEKQAFDYNYNLKEFSSEISDQIFEITKGLQDWSPGRNQKTNQVIDTYIYLSFRIKDGKIIRIYP